MVLNDWCIESISNKKCLLYLSGAWTNNSERVWITYTPLLVLSCWKLGHRDSILNCPEHYNWFEPIFGSLIFRFISVRWIGMQNLPYRRHFSTHLWKTTLFYILFSFFYKAKTCLRSREVLFSQPLCIFFLANSAHSFSHVKIFFLYLGHWSISRLSIKLPDSENRTIATVCPPSCFNKQSLQQNVQSILIDHINILNSENTV